MKFYGYEMAFGVAGFFGGVLKILTMQHPHWKARLTTLVTAVITGAYFGPVFAPGVQAVTKASTEHSIAAAGVIAGIIGGGIVSLVVELAEGITAKYRRKENSDA